MNKEKAKQKIADLVAKYESEKTTGVLRRYSEDDTKRIFIMPLFRAQEIWWCSLGANVGVETDGKNDLFQRPVIIFRKFNKEMFWGLPLTSKGKSDKPFYFSISFHDDNITAVLSQIRTLSAKRLIRRMGKLSDKQFFALEKTMGNFLKETNPLRGSQVPNGNKYNNVSK